MFLQAKYASLLLDGAAIGGGAACGALLRYGATKVQEHYKCGPWGVCVINMAGSFVLGALSVSSQVDQRLKLMVGVGFCGT
jgi:fluoride ion exporter CrcB/FEX